MKFMVALQYTDVGHYMEPLKVQLEGSEMYLWLHSKVSSHRDTEKSLGV